MYKITLLLAACVVSVFINPGAAFATPDFAENTRQGCVVCHLDEDGGALNDTGLSYLFSGYKWPPPENAKSIIKLKRPFRAVVGFFHIASAIMWFGTIIYVHLVLKPAYAFKGLPKSEVKLGVISIIVIGISGVLLTLSRINDVSVLFDTRWGVLLSVKIALYLFLVLSASVVLLFIGPRLKPGGMKAVRPKDGVFDPSILKAFDGKEGRPSYIAFQGNVYDVSELAKWKGGIHFKHLSGANLTNSLARAPHGEEMLERAGIVGTYAEKNSITSTQKTFYIMAYINLAVVFVTIAVISLWRFGM